MDSSIVYRRALHRIPELDSNLPETEAFVRNTLTGLPCRLFFPVRDSICAYFNAGKRDTVAFRADMDALPITEKSGLSFASEHPGKMHACGHDAHTALALTLAEYAAVHLKELPRNVLFIFQPAEETTGGAKRICETGVLEKYRVRRIFGLHLWPELAEGSVWSRPGPLMARSSEITVSLTGKSVHISKYREGVDALTAGVEYLRRAYAMMAQIPSENPSLLRFGKMDSGEVRNAVSGHTELQGSLRTYSESTFGFCRRQLQDIGKAVASETGCAVTVRLSEGYPAVWNHEELYAELVAGLGSGAPQLLPEPALAAEDFSFYQQYVPGVFFFLGAGTVPALHSPEFVFNDETVLPQGLNFLKKLLMLS